MGCDYYTWVETVILWKDAQGKERHYKEKPGPENYERNYSFRDYGSYDPDLEEAPAHDQELKDAIYSYGKKILFENGEWICTEVGKQRILQVCEEHKIPVESITVVYKKMNGYWR